LDLSNDETWHEPDDTAQTSFITKKLGEMDPMGEKKYFIVESTLVGEFLRLQFDVTNPT
jgi:hypothetical protein